MHRSPLTQNGIVMSPEATGLIPFPFGPDFQTKLLKVLMMDDAGELIMEWIKPTYFEGPEMRWAFAEMQIFWKAKACMPTWTVLKHRAKSADAKMRDTIFQMLIHLENLTVKEESWIREQILEWIRENLFHTAFKETKSLWDNGKRTAAMEHMQKSMDQVKESVWKQVDRGWFFEELGAREGKRELKELHQDAIPTGIPELDSVLDGGLSPGELGIWIAYAKGGKSTMLMNHGAQAIRCQHKKVLHFILEGSRSLIENRYDAWFADEYYSTLKKGRLQPHKFKQLHEEYQFLRNKLVVRGLVSNWNYTILDIGQELDDLRKNFGWIPDLVIVDYGDLLHGRGGPYQAPWMSERDAFRDLKLLANRGFAVWTASQAQRPESKNYDTKEHCIKVSQIAGGIEKVRVCDFVGSCNQTLEEKGKNEARLFAELYRDNEAGKVITIATELAKMKMGITVSGPPNASIGLGPKPTQGPPVGWIEGPNGTLLPQHQSAPAQPSHFYNPSPTGGGNGL